MNINFTTVITSYNRRRCIERAINSAIMELPDHEIVVVDDASTDRSPLFLKERYAHEIEQGAIKLHCLGSNLGVTGAKNFGYQQAQGDWVIFLDSDDYYKKGSGSAIRQEMLKALNTHSMVLFRCQNHAGEFYRENSRDQAKEHPPRSVAGYGWLCLSLRPFT